MAFDTRTRLDEIMLRFGVDGNLAGAYRRDIAEVYDTDTGTVLGARYADPIPIQAADLGPLVGEQTAALIEQVDRLTRDLALARVQIESLAPAPADPIAGPT